MCKDIFCWNVRGFNIYSHRNGFKNWFKSNKPLLGGLLETHVKQLKHVKFINELLPGWLHEDNYVFSDLGKIWLLWHPSVRVVVISKSLQMITCEVTWPDPQSEFVVSMVYASNSVEERKLLWSELEAISSTQAVRGKPWIVLGDFNQVLQPQEHSKAATLNIDTRTREFRNCLLNAELFDLNFRGSTYTWWNKRKSAPVAKKIDRVLVNDLWLDLFPDSVAEFGPPDFSDHAPATVVLNPQSQRAHGPFKFFNYLLKNKDFVTDLAYHWYSSNVTGSAMLRVSKKLKLLKFFICNFSKDNYSNLEKRVREAHAILLSSQADMLATPTTANAEKEQVARERWQILATAEESFFYQRSRVTWLSLGDSNTAYYHRMVKSRRAANHIHYLLHSDGTRIDSQAGIVDHCVSYFSSLLGGETDPPDVCSIRH